MTIDMRNTDENEAVTAEIAAKVSASFHKAQAPLAYLFQVARPSSKDVEVWLEETRGIQVYWVAKGGYIDSSTRCIEKTQIEKDFFGFSVQEPIDNFNLWKVASDIEKLGARRLYESVLQRVFTALDAASYNKRLIVPSYSLREEVDSIVDSYEDKNISGSITGRGKTIRRLVSSVSGDKLYKAPKKSDPDFFYGTYRDIPLIRIKHYTSEQMDTEIIKENDLYFIPKSYTKCVFWDGLHARSWLEEDADYWHFMTRQTFGFLVAELVNRLTVE